MKPEPLKDKLREKGAEMYFQYFDLEDIKSAVEWLRQEITVKDKESIIENTTKKYKPEFEQKKRELIDMAKGLDGDDKEKIDLLIEFWEDMIKEMPKMIVELFSIYSKLIDNKINKAFEDVIKCNKQ